MTAMDPLADQKDPEGPEIQARTMAWMQSAPAGDLVLGPEDPAPQEEEHVKQEVTKAAPQEQPVSSQKVLDLYTGEDYEKKLFEAACRNNLSGLSKLVAKKGVNINSLVEKGRPSLFGAVYAGHEEAVQILLEAGADAAIRDDSQASALHYACLSAGSPEIVRLLLAAGADPDAVTQQGATPLELLISHGTAIAVECAHELLRAGASSEGQPGAPRTLMHHLIMLRDDPEFLSALLEDGSADLFVPDSSGNLPIHLAVDLERMDCIKHLVAADLSLSSSNLASQTSIGRPNGAGLTVLHLAAARGNALLCEFLGGLLADKPEVLKITDPGGHTALHIAAAEGNLDCVRALAGSGMDLNAVNNQGLTALHLAMSNQLLEVATALIEAGTELSTIVNATGASYLHLAAQMGMDAMIPVLIEYGAELMAVDRGKRTALHTAAYCGSDRMCRTLVELGVHAGEVDRSGCLAMHYAAMGGQVDSLQYLLQHGANMRPDPITVDARTFASRDLMYLAALSGQPEAVAMLLDLDMGDMKDNMDRDARSALHAAAMGGSAECVLLLLDAGWPWDAKDYKGRTPLFLAAEYANLHALKILVDAGATVMAKSRPWETPLHAAARANFPEGALCLVEAGHEVDSTEHRRRTALHEAAYNGHTLVALALVRMGANIEAKDKYGLSPVAAAVSAGHRYLAKAIEDEACRSADFHHRDYMDTAYTLTTVSSSQLAAATVDIDDVPEPYTVRRRRRGHGKEESLIDGFGSPHSPSSPNFRRRGALDEVDGGLGNDEDDIGGDASVTIKDLVSDVESIEDPEMKHMLMQLNKDLTTRLFASDEGDEEENKSLGSDLGSDYAYEDDGDLERLESAAVGTLRSLS